MLKIEPLNATVFIKLNRESNEKKSAGGIIVQVDNDEIHMDTGIIESLGPLAFIDDAHSKANVKVGDEVTFDRYSGKEIRDPVDGSITHRIMPDTAIWGRVKRDKSKRKSK